QVGFGRRPIDWAARNLQRRQMLGLARRTENLVWAAVPRWMSVASAMRAGLVSFGLPLDGPPPEVKAAVLRHHNGTTWVDTPVARFLLTIGDEISQAAIDDLS